MKLVSGLALASATLLAVSAHAAAPDPAPTLATDAQGTTLTGAHHLNGAAFSLIVTDWWLTGTIAAGQAPDVRLLIEVHLPTYPLLDRATDAAGHKLDVVILNRGPSARWSHKASERIAVVLPRDYAEKARATGLVITVSGKDRAFPFTVPAEALAHFLDAYAQAAGHAGATPAPATPVPAAPISAHPIPASPVPAAPPASATPGPLPAAPIVPQAPVAPPPQPTAAPPLSRPVPPPPATAPVAQPTPSRITPPQAPTAPQAPSPQATPAAAADDDDPAITPIQDKRVRLPNGQFAPTPPPAPAPSPASPPPPAAAAPEEESGGHGTWVDTLGLQFVATSSGALVLTTKPGSIAAAKGIESGDFIEAVDGAPIKTLDADQMAARIGAPGVRVLHMIAAGDIRLR